MQRYTTLSSKTFCTYDEGRGLSFLTEMIEKRESRILCIYQFALPGIGFIAGFAENNILCNIC